MGVNGKKVDPCEIGGKKKKKKELTTPTQGARGEGKGMDDSLRKNGQ